MNDIDKSWLKYVALGGGGGFVIGEIISTILRKFVFSDSWTLLLNVITPVFTIIGLLIVLYYYNKSKFD